MSSEDEWDAFESANSFPITTNNETNNINKENNEDKWNSFEESTVITTNIDENTIKDIENVVTNNEDDEWDDFEEANNKSTTSTLENEIKGKSQENSVPIEMNDELIVPDIREGDKHQIDVWSAFNNIESNINTTIEKEIDNFPKVELETPPVVVVEFPVIEIESPPLAEEVDTIIEDEIIVKDNSKETEKFNEIEEQVNVKEENVWDYFENIDNDVIISNEDIDNDVNIEKDLDHFPKVELETPPVVVVEVPVIEIESPPLVEEVDTIIEDEIIVKKSEVVVGVINKITSDDEIEIQENVNITDITVAFTDATLDNSVSTEAKGGEGFDGYSGISNCGQLVDIDRDIDHDIDNDNDNAIDNDIDKDEIIQVLKDEKDLFRCSLELNDKSESIIELKTNEFVLEEDKEDAKGNLEKEAKEVIFNSSDDLFQSNPIEISANNQDDNVNDDDIITNATEITPTNEIPDTVDINEDDFGDFGDFEGVEIETKIDEVVINNDNIVDNNNYKINDTEDDNEDAFGDFEDTNQTTTTVNDDEEFGDFGDFEDAVAVSPIDNESTSNDFEAVTPDNNTTNDDDDNDDDINIKNNQDIKDNEDINQLIKDTNQEIGYSDDDWDDFEGPTITTTNTTTTNDDDDITTNDDDITTNDTNSNVNNISMNKDNEEILKLKSIQTSNIDEVKIFHIYYIFIILND
jgi:hypothetical protein